MCGREVKGFAQLLLLSELTSLRIEQTEKIPPRVTAMIYACQECVGYRNFGMPELNTLGKTSGTAGGFVL